MRDPTRNSPFYPRFTARGPAQYSESPTEYGFYNRTIARLGKAKSHPKVQLQRRCQMQIDCRENEMLLVLHAIDRFYRTHVAVVLDRRRQPFKQIITDQS